MAATRIVIVDDEAGIVRLCHRVLERDGNDVISFTEPQLAFEYFQKNQVDLLLTDLRMPGMDGFELISKCKLIQPDLVVLVMTGFGTIEMAIQALNKGIEGLILKPFEQFSDLVDAVHRVLAESKKKRDAARLDALRPLFAVSEAFVSETTPQALERLILNSISGMSQARCVGIYLRSSKQKFPEPISSCGDTLDESKHQVLLDLLLRAEEMTGAYSVNENGPGDEELQEKLRQIGWSSFAVAVVKRKRANYTFYTARDAGSPAFSDSDLEMCTILFRQSAVALENARLYSDLREYVRKVEESQTALIQAEKLAAVGRLTASVAHEINNPLQSVRNCLHLAGMESIELDQRRLYLDLAQSELDRLAKIVQRMLEFYRPGREGAELLAPTDLIGRVLDLLGPQLRDKDIKVIKEEQAPLPKVMGVKDQLQQVIFNILLNAIDAIDQTPKPRQIWVDVSLQGENIQILLEDSGTGIIPGFEEQIFEPFITTKENGTGLGLAVSYGIIEAHGGTLGVIPGQHGEGACFRILLKAEGGEKDE